MRAFLLLLVASAIGGLWWKRDEAIQIANERAPFLAAYLPKGSGPAVAAVPGGGAAPAAPARPPVPVVVAKAATRETPITIDAVGTVQAVASIPLKPRVDSQIAAIFVEEGAQVKQGDLLIQLDQRALKAQLAQAEASLQKNRAQLEQTRRDLARAEELLAKRIGTEVQRDNAFTAVKVGEAQVAADEANRENLAALLSYTEIRAPVSGRIGSIPLKVGTAVRSADSQAIATINQLDPIYVAFAVPQIAFPDLRAAMAAGPVRVEAKIGRATVAGKMAFTENAVDLATGTVQAKAAFANPQERLWPGTFVNVQVVLGVERDAMVVPSAAIQLGQRGPYVFVVGEDRK
ncbi:MAG: efflux RND transporter periplasmic adaptor subunit, partial [Methylobacteriaceae bacterium]|nr:efflux RND transporter periplasmic adaptor subunit [Methylobacteriaceae bacterium]